MGDMKVMDTPIGCGWSYRNPQNMSTLPPRRRERLFVMVHVHKSGGSLMCSWAYKMNERVVYPSEFCASVFFADFRLPWWAKKMWDSLCPAAHVNMDLTCDMRNDHFKDFTFAKIERPLVPGDLCFDRYDYGIVLRHPLARIISQVNYEGPKDFMPLVECIERRLEPDCASFDKGLMTMTYTLFDNFAIRILLGPKVFALPPGGITEAHFNQALGLLGRFKLVLPLEKIHTMQAMLDMDYVLGWHIPVKSPIVNHKPYTIPFKEEESQRIWNINHWDRTLHDTILRLFTERAQANRNDYIPT